MTIVWLFSGVVLICWGSHYFIQGVIDIGKRLKWSEFVSGMIIVGFGTSVPEIAISIYSAITTHGGILIGNVIGSNITNALLVMGLALLIRPVTTINYFNVSNAGSFIVATLLLLLGISLGYFPRWLGLLMLLAAIGSVWVLTRHYANPDPSPATGKRISWYGSVAKSVIGLIFLLVSSEVIVKNAVKLATIWHINQSIVAMTIIAIGTSLPEIVLSVMASYRGYSDLVVGNIIGSNISNILLAVGLPAFIKPFSGYEVNRIAVSGLVLGSMLFLVVTGIGSLRKRQVGMAMILIYLIIYGLIWWN